MRKNYWEKFWVFLIDIACIGSYFLIRYWVRQYTLSEVIHSWGEHLALIFLIILFTALGIKSRTEFFHFLQSPSVKRIIGATIDKVIRKEKLLITPISDYLGFLKEGTDAYARKIIADRLKNSITSVKQCREDFKFDVRSSELYKYIRDSLEDRQCEQFLIIDHDIRRWRELDEDTYAANAYNTFNYSNDILNITCDRGTRKKATFNLKRLFIIKDDEWRELACEHRDSKCNKDCADYNKCAVKPIASNNPEYFKIVKQIGDVEQDIKTKTGGTLAAETRICVYPWLKQSRHATSKTLLKLNDIVIMNKSLVFREKFNIENREVSEKTESEVTCHPDDLKECQELFDEIWNNSWKTIYLQS